MKEYLINSGEFNIIVRPFKKEYFILDDDESSISLLEDFVQGVDVNYEKLEPYWFSYKKNESWCDFDNNTVQLDVDFSESDLIDTFVLKKFNFGGLVAIRDVENKEVKIFKKERLYQN